MKKMGKYVWMVLVFVLLFSFAGLMASAQEVGYWSERIDEEGRVVRVFTYTEPIVITEIEGEPMEEDLQGDDPALPPTDRIEQVVEAPVYLSDGASAHQTTETVGFTAGVIALGILSLAGLAIAFYKAI